ncbi:NitT/TauT family transport system substrate-binding protein [Mumia flava]|uniref:NitT/TauT family transport system substrate-binding protein n=1 Tax=Mumia flava TaxID=1348852 RepID=A0A0B2B779_9ACTN|nr:ABC transporter substrate-binding protein [Mumia flava]PJJ57530.1 NitT/TauT family transport system substrate-binding protein [Mumia flava]
MTRKRSIAAAAAALAASAALAACGGGDDGGDGGSGSETDQVTVGVIPIVDVAPIYLGDEQGFFEDEGIDLTLETGQGGAAIVPGVASGQFQFGFSNVTSLILAESQDLPLTMVAPGNSTTGEVGDDFGAVVAPEGSDIAEPADLAGKRVAVNTLNNIGSTTINKVVRDDGGDPSTIEYVELGFPDMPGALSNGQVDAAWVVEPFLAITEGQGATPVAWNFAATDPELMIAAYFTSEQTAQSDPDLVERFTNAMEESLQYASDNPDEARAILSSYTEIDAETAEQLTLPTWPTEINEDSVQLLADLALEDGLIDSEPDIEAMLP